MKNYWLTILFWGSLWGMAESSAGYMLHLAAVALPGLPGFIMFPIAFYFMKGVYNATGKTASIMHVSILAGLLKFSDFLLSVYIPIRIINPALAIILEGWAVYSVYSYCVQKKISVGYIPTFLMGAAWRALFLIHLSIISLFGQPAALVTDGIMTSLRFLFLESFINSILIYAYLRMAKIRPRLQIRPVHAYAALVLALGMQLMV